MTAFTKTQKSWLLFSLAMLIAGGSTLWWLTSEGEAADPSLVQQDITASADGLTLTLEWVRFGGTASIATLRAEGLGSTTKVLLEPARITAAGFADGEVLVVDREPGTVDVRVPPLEPPRGPASLTVRQVALVDDSGSIEVLGGPWHFVVRTPPADQLSEVLAVEELEPILLASGAQVRARRSAVETLLEFVLPAGQLPLGPPEIVANDGTAVLGQELGTRATGAASTHLFGFEATQAGTSIEFRMSPILRSTGSDRASATLDVLEVAGRSPQVGTNFEVVRPPVDPAGPLAVTRFVLLAEQSPDKAGANLLVEVNAHLAEYLPLQPGQSGDPVGGGRFVVTDAAGARIQVVGVGSWTGTSGTGPANPGVAPGSELALIATPELDLKQLTVTVFGPADVIQPGDLLTLRAR